MRACNEDVVYLLNSVVVFHTEGGILTSRRNGSVVTLHTPSSHCLLKLIEESPRIVSQTELMIAGWPETSEQVSPNTFYQMVFNLRQGLEKVGGKGIVVTVPRQGLKIKTGISVETLAGLKEDEFNKNNAPEHVLSDVSNNMPVKKGRSITLIALAAIFITISVALLTSTSNTNIFKGYDKTHFRMCSVNFNGVIDKNDVGKLLAKSRTDCSRPQKIILTQSENNSRVSVISCTDADTEMQKCTLSLYVK